jgi:DNA-binding NtrC family response regulator
MNLYLQRYLGLDDSREYAQPAGLPSLRTLERDYIRFLLDVTARNRTEVSRILAISRSSLYHKLRAYNIMHSPPENRR